MTTSKPKARARRAFGRLRRLPSGRYQAAYQGPDLQLHNAPATFDTKDRAEGWLSAERRLIDLDIWTSPAERAAQAAAEAEKNVLFADYATKVVATRVSRRGKPLARRTIDSYTQLLRDHINPTFGNQPIPNITPEMVRTWYSNIERIRPRDRKSKATPADTEVPTTRARAYEVLRMVLNVAVEDELIIQNPCRIKGATAVEPAHDATVLTPGEIAALAAAMPPELSASVLLAAWCGLRPSETYSAPKVSTAPSVSFSGCG